MKDPMTPKIPETPKTADWQTEALAYETPPYSSSKSLFGSLQKKNAIRHKRQASDESEEWRKDPPPLYTKHPTEGGAKAWMSVAGSYVPNDSH